MAVLSGPKGNLSASKNEGWQFRVEQLSQLFFEQLGQLLYI